MSDPEQTPFEFLPRDEEAIEKALIAVREEIVSAVRKHGRHNTPMTSYDTMLDGERLAILMEEVGEVAGELTYDKGTEDGLLKELIQVAAVAVMWRAGRD